MSCLICAQEIAPEYLTTTVGDVYQRSLCELLDLNFEEYCRVLPPANYCGSCRLLLDLSASVTTALETTETQSIRDDEEARRRNKKERRDMVSKSLISSWMKLQSENLKAEGYCAWQSVRLKILLDIGAVMEMEECSSYTAECEWGIGPTGARLPNEKTVRWDEGYTWTEAEKQDFMGVQSNRMRSEKPEVTCHYGQTALNRKVETQSHVIALSQVASGNGQIDAPVNWIEKGSSSDGNEIQVPSGSETDGTGPGEPQNKQSQANFSVSDKSRLHVERNSEKEETGRRSRRKPLKPTKGIYELQPQNRADIEPFGSRLRELLTMKKPLESYGSHKSENLPSAMPCDTNEVKEMPQSNELETFSSEAIICGAALDVVDHVEEIEQKPIDESDFKMEENMTNTLVEKAKEESEIIVKEEESGEIMPQVNSPEEKTVKPKEMLFPPELVQGIEEIEAAAVLNIMKHSKEYQDVSSTKKQSVLQETRRSPRKARRKRQMDEYEKVGFSVNVKPARSRASFSPDITADLPRAKQPLAQTMNAGFPRMDISEEESSDRILGSFVSGKCGAENKEYSTPSEPLKASGTTNLQRPDVPREKSQKYKCGYERCGRTFPTAERRANHYKRHHEGIRNLFSCSICGKSFPARTRLATHLERHEQEGKSYPCNECGKSFATQKKLDFHLYQHSQNWGLYCDICNKGFPPGQELRLANHKKIHDESRPRPFKCSECDRTFSSQQYLNIHTKNHPITPDPDGLFRCPYESCRQSFKAVTSYREHTKIHTGELPFECNVCGKKFGYVTGYKKHMISHTDEKHHTCHICGKQFKQKGNLNLHISRHAGVKPFKCEHPGCGYSFFDQYKLKNHMDVHTGRRRFKCEDCDKYFRTSTGLKSHHQAVHAKERKYKCHCGKAFSQKQYLQFHKTQHPELNLKRFTCDFCSKKFSEPSSLREHKRRFHTGETAFQCDKCSYTACFKSRMDKHLLTHSSPQLKCPSCDKFFRHQNNLQRHVATVHIKKGMGDAAQA